MVFKLVIGDKGKSWKFETDSEAFIGKSLNESVKGEEFNADLSGYEFEITGATDSAGFPHSNEVEGVALKKILLTKGWGMRDSTPGIRRRKTVRGKVLSDRTAQINMKVIKEGSKKLAEVFPDQNKAPEVAPQENAQAPTA